MTDPPTARKGSSASRPGASATTVATLTTVVAVLPVFLIGGLAVQLGADLHMTPASLGIVVAVFWAVSSLLSPPAGAIAGSLGTRRGMVLAVSLGFIALLGITVGTPSWGWLALWLAVAGSANALSHPVSNSLIVSQVSIRNRAFAFGLKQAAIPVSTLVAGLSVPLLALTVGWRWTFALTALLALLLIPALVRVVPRRPPRPRGTARPRDAGKVPRELRPFLIATATASGLGSAQANVVGAFTVSSAVAAGFGTGEAGLLLGVASVAGILARPLVGIAADRGIGGSMATVAIMMGAGFMGLIGMASGHKAAFAVGAILAFGFGWGWNGLIHYVVSHRAHPFTARATGITQSGTYLGGTLGPLIFGFIFTHYGPGIGWSLAAAVSALGISAALVAFRLEKLLDPPLPES